MRLKEQKGVTSDLTGYAGERRASKGGHGSSGLSQTPGNALQQAQIDQEVDETVLIGNGGAVA
jgi:hypothetical protein